MKCLKDRWSGSMKWTGCYSPIACKGFGYCRERNIAAGGMANVTPEMRREWMHLDQGDPA